MQLTFVHECPRYLISIPSLDSITGLIMSINSVGTILATPVSGWLCDKYGRRFAMGTGSALIIVAAVLQSAAVHVAMICIGRFILGFGSAICGVASPTLITEMAPARMRGRLTGTYNCFWYAGSLIAAGVTYGTLTMGSTGAFRIPLALQALPSLVNLSLIWFISESPRWLVANNREEEAWKLLVKLHANGDESDPVVKAEFEEITQTIEEEKKVKRSSWYELIATRKYQSWLLYMFQLSTVIYTVFFLSKHYHSFKQLVTDTV
jgi:MFS family permease